MSGPKIEGQGRAGTGDGPAAGRERPARRTTRPTSRRRSAEQVDPARRAAFAVVRAVHVDDAYANLVMPTVLRAASLTGRDAGFATELAYGTLRGRGSYDAVLARCVDRPLDQVEPAVLDALRLGVHQLLAMRVPSHAAVAATVELVRTEVGQAAAGFANAVLRGVARHDAEGWWAELGVPADVASATGADAEALAVRWSHPTWVVRALAQALAQRGRDAGELPALLAADNDPARVVLAALPGLCDRDDLRTADGGATTPGRWSPTAAVLTGGGEPRTIDAVRRGHARVQDEGSQLVATALPAVPMQGRDERWLDLCAGPGGKAALLAAIGRARGATLTAVEISDHRAELVRSALRPVGPGAVVRVADGRLLGTEEPGEYDRVLVDAPCTGLGALRRRPEARWRRQPSDLAALGPLQRALLTSALAVVRPGGVVVYATCSPHLAETGFVVSDVLRRHGDTVEQLDARPFLPGVEHLGGGPDVQLWPHLHGTDAMYLAVLRRTDPSATGSAGGAG